MLSEFGNEKPDTEKSKLSEQFQTLYLQAMDSGMEDTRDGGDGEGGEGAGTGATQQFVHHSACFNPLVSPPCQDIGAAHCAGINSKRSVHNLYFQHIQEIPFQCIRKVYWVLQYVESED